MNSNIFVFMYHDIRDLHQTKFKERYKMKSFLRNTEFVRQIEYIEKQFQIISTDELLQPDQLNNNRAYAVITFDDGLKDQYKFVDFLKKRNIRATFFLPSKPIVNRAVFHSHKIQFILAVQDHGVIKDEILSYIDKKERKELLRKYSVSLWKNNVWSKDMIFITNFLRYHPDDKKFYICNLLFKKYVTNDEKSFADDLYMTERDCDDLLNHNMIIGGHGHLSLDLTTLSPDSQYNDIKQNYQFIRQLYNSDDFNFIFSYPNGAYNQETIRILKQFQCKLAFTIKDKYNHNYSDLEFGRIDPTKYEFN